MPDHQNLNVKGRWQQFVQAIRSVLPGVPEHRHEDQFLAMQEAALRLAESQKMADDIETGYSTAVRTTNGSPTLSADAVEVVLMELDAFPLAVRVHESETRAGSAKPGGRKRLCGAAKTILGSVKELFKLTEFGKAVIEVLKEAVELVGGDSSPGE